MVCAWDQNKVYLALRRSEARRVMTSETRRVWASERVLHFFQHGQ